MKRIIITAMAAMLLLGNQSVFARSKLATIPTVVCLGEKEYTPAEMLKYVNESAKAEKLGIILPDNNSAVQPYSFTEALPGSLHGLIKR